MCVCVCVYIYICVCVYMNVYVCDGISGVVIIIIENALSS